MLRRSRPSLPQQRGQSNLPTLARSSRQPQLANPYRFARHEAAQQVRKLYQLSDGIICHSWHSPFYRKIEITVADHIPVPSPHPLFGRDWHIAAFAVPHHFGRFSNRPSGVKHFQTIHDCSVDVAHGLVLLFGIGTRALPAWESRTRWNNLTVGLAVL